MEPTLATEFAPASRDTQSEVTRQHLLVSRESLVRQTLDTIPNMTLVLNRHRQIVHANRAFLEFVGESDPERIIGFRPGEVVRCIHSDVTPGGCGTARFCRTCGAVNAVLDSQSGGCGERECRVTRRLDGEIDALDLHVRANSIQVVGEEYTIVTIADISGEKRRRALERIFFHDVLNTAGGVRGFAELLDGHPHRDDEVKKISQILRASTEQLVMEIESQRILTSAEQGDLVTHPEAIHSLEFLEAIRGTALGLDAGDEGFVEIGEAASLVFESDGVLLARVVGNMVRNALEASQPGETVTLGAVRDGDGIRFAVTNPAVMPEDVRLQVFQRSFSTKGRDRGLGTWSMKLLGEKYLGGEVSFTSTEGEGTTFSIRVPLR